MSELQKTTTLVKPAVVYVSTVFSARVIYTTADGQLLFPEQSQPPYQTGGTGSGFIVNPDGFVVTNAHVVEPSPDLIDKFSQYFLQQLVAGYQAEAGRAFSEEEIGRLVAQIQSQGTITLVDLELQPISDPEDVPREVTVMTKAGLTQVKGAQTGFPAEVRAVSTFSEKDIAVLKISARNLPTVPLGNSDEVQLQDTVTVIGYPGAVQSTFEYEGLFSGDSLMEVTITQGIISSFKTWRDGSPILGTDAATTHGNSGGPAFNDRGEVIGVLSMGALTPYSQAFGFNFLRPINVAKDFLRASGVETAQSLTDTRYAEAMGHFWKAEDLEDAGKATAARREYEAAKDSLQSVIALYPQHPDAGRYTVRAEEKLSSLPTGISTASWVGGAVGGVALLIGIAVLGLRRKSSREAPPAAGRPARPAGGTAGPGPKVWQLVAESGSLQGNRFAIAPSGLVLGRDPSRCQVVCSGDTVSREHARIQPGPEGIVLTNLSTTNKTYVNDEAVSQTSIRPGDRVRVGDVTFRVEG